MGYTEPIETAEIRELTDSYGQVELERIQLEIDEELYYNRLMKASDRRGEVVFAIQMPSGILVHHKAFYGNGVYRLPSGGIDYGEKVIDALHREVQEETGLRCVDERLLGVQDCQLKLDGRSVRFVSYIFHVHGQGDLRLDTQEGIDAIRLVPPSELKDIAESLRHVAPPHGGWGRWRALAHDLVYHRLTGQS